MYDSDELLKKITNPWGPLDEAVALSTKVIQSEPTFDMVLARKLPRFDNPGDMDPRRAERALDVLDAVSPGPRLVMIVGHLMQHPNERLKSKAALFLAKRVQNMRWNEKYLQEADPRVRANIVESLWEIDSPGNLQLLWGATQDRHHRVAVNACIGLYRMKDKDASRLLIDMSVHASPEFRLGAVWAMGRLCDAQFSDALTARLRDDDLKVKNMAVRAIMENKRASAAVPLAIAG